MPPLRAAESLSLIVFAAFAILAWLPAHLTRARRLRITVIVAAALAVIFLAPLLPGAIRDWVPLLLLTLFYWQAGQFVTRPDAAFEARLLALDRKLIVPLMRWCAAHRAGAWLLTYLELSYFSYYAVMPGSLAALYLTHRAVSIDRYWTAVLLAHYASCAVLPFLATRPPRAVDPQWGQPPCDGRMRRFNLWILDRGSIQTNTFPSAHVAIATASALSLLSLTHLWVGLIFLWIAAGIALATAACRYHYSADAILGAATGAAAVVCAFTF